VGLFIVLLLLVLAGLALLLLWAGRYVVGSGMRELLLVRGRRMWSICCDRIHDLTGSWLLDMEGYERLLAWIRTGVLPETDQIGAGCLRALAYVLVTLVSTVLMLSELAQVKQWLARLGGRLFHRGFGSAVGHVGWTYLRAQLLILAAVTSICVAGLLAARVRGWLLIGIGIGICDALPFLGTGICFLPWALWRLLNGQYLTAVWFLALYVLTSMTRQLLEPRLIGKRIGVPPLLVLISVYVGVKVYSRGGFLLGPISAFLIWQISSERVDMEDAYESEQTGAAKDDSI
jgi:predicted PurR-regulated permease PerM